MAVRFIFGWSGEPGDMVEAFLEMGEDVIEFGPYPRMDGERAAHEMDDYLGVFVLGAGVRTAGFIPMDVENSFNKAAENPKRTVILEVAQ